jgi:RHS repeat-associated protein
VSDKSGVSAQVISLPNGGGALHGLGEKFSPDLHTGVGNFSVPILVPPGRSGLQPRLTLAYSTGAGNGPFGLGWTLGVPGVSRQTARGVPRYEEEADVYILSGAEDLVPVAGHFPGRVRYRPRTEGLFARVERQLDPASDYWDVRTRDGLVSVYGTPGRRGDDPAAQTPSDDAARIFAWRLTETRDPFGNRIVYEYRHDEGHESGHRWRQPLLKRIRYADYSDDAGQTRFLVSVTLVYDDEPDAGHPGGRRPRPDPFSDYRAGFEIRTTRRCTSIVTATEHGIERRVLAYRLVYLDERDDLEDLAARQPLNGVSLLSLIHVLGYDDAGVAHAELPPLELDYTAFEPRTRRDFFPLSGPDLPSGSLARAEYELADLGGRGLPDIVEIAGTVRYWANLGDGRFDLARPMAEAPAGLELADPHVQLVDADGDGRIDLLVTSGGESGYFPLQHDRGWDRASFRPHASAPTFGLADPEVRLVDLDGDGVTDALRTGSRLEHYFNHPTKGWHHVVVVERGPLERCPDVTFSDPRVRLADLNGDGLQDIVLVSDGNVEYWPSLGHAAWGPRLGMRSAPRFPAGHDPRRVLLGDVDGDGLADLLYVDDARVTLWINRGGDAWSDPVVIEGTPPVTEPDAVRLVDLRGSGVSGVLWTADQDGSGRPRSFFLDLTGAGKPYLLHRMDNRLGAVTEVRYAASTAFRLDDERDPARRWRTPLPFPVQVVAAVHVTDVFSGSRLTSEFRYHHGHWDGGERELRGFGLVEQRDTETALAAGGDGRATVPPTCTKTWFHQGPIGPEEGDWREGDARAEFWPGDPSLFPRHPELDAILGSRVLPRRARRDALRALAGHVLRIERYALDGSERQGRPLTVSETWLGVREEEPPAAGEPDRPRIFFAMARGQRTTEWGRGRDPLTRFDLTDDHDPFGQPRLKTQVACPRGWRALEDRPGRPYLATRTRTAFATPATPGPYIHDRVASVTTRELVNDGTMTIAALLERPDAAMPVIAQTLSFYDRDPARSDAGAFTGLPLGRLGDFGALVRSERLALTDALLAQVHGAGVPPYLAAGGGGGAGQPAEFLTLVGGAGYVDRRSGSDPTVVPGLFVTTACRRHDVHADPGGRGRGLVLATRDPLGHETTIAYDHPYQLLPVRVTDPVGNPTSALYDGRTLQPRRMTDANGNDTLVTFTPMGLPESFRLRGKMGEGDQARPSVRFRYDFWALARSRPGAPQPISVTTVRHVHHDAEADVSLPERDEVIESREYSDGFGRLLQTRTRGEDLRFGSAEFGGGDALLPADQRAAGPDPVGTPNGDPARPNVVVSGWQIYDDKGRVVEKYEPFFSTGWEYAPPRERQLGSRTRLAYDARGLVVCTIAPDGSEQRMVPGVPLAADDPERFEPTPWETYLYDANDNAGRTHATSAAGYRGHWDTPASVEIDGLGRVVSQVVRNGPQPGDRLTTRFVHDVRGNLLATIDALGRVAVADVFDLLDRRLRRDSPDAGSQVSVLDAAGNAVEVRDARGAWRLQARDVAGRPTHLWARDRAGEPLTLRERLVYGDDPAAGLGPAEIAVGNLRGRLHRHYDEAGRLTVTAYDLQGNTLRRVREVVASGQVLTAFASAPGWNVTAYRTDWTSGAGSGPAALAARAVALLDATPYETTMAYDALGRVKSLEPPPDATGRRARVRPAYNRAGAIERVTVDGHAYVRRIAYDARGQRTLVALGNGVLTRLAYGPETARLVRLRSEAYEESGAGYRLRGGVLQDLACEHDVMGNLLALRDRTPSSGLAAHPDRLDRVFTYDALYRLRTATGREHDGPLPAAPWDDAVRGGDPTRTRAYIQDYAYDAIGNVQSLTHAAGPGSFRRDFALAPGTNRLATLTVGSTTYTYDHDASGNLVRENAERHLEWDHAGRLRVFRVQAEAAGAPAGSGQLAEPSRHAHYLYDGGGRRTLKVVRTQGGGVETTVYVDGTFEHHRWTEAGRPRQCTWLHVMDGRNRVAIVRAGDPRPGAAGPAVQYHLADHLGSSHVVVGGAGPGDRAFVDREEYHPYGETSFGSFGRKRYRFSGKERDEESGLGYFEARYYASWLARWTSCDPAGTVDGPSLYVYARDNPLTYGDPAGTASKKAPTTAAEPAANPGAAAPAPGNAPAAPEAPVSQAGGAPIGQSSIATVEQLRETLRLQTEQLAPLVAELHDLEVTLGIRQLRDQAGDLVEAIAEQRSAGQDVSVMETELENLREEIRARSTPRHAELQAQVQERTAAVSSARSAVQVAEGPAPPPKPTGWLGKVKGWFGFLLPIVAGAVATYQGQEMCMNAEDPVAAALGEITYASGLLQIGAGAGAVAGLVIGSEALIAGGTVLGEVAGIPVLYIANIELAREYNAQTYRLAEKAKTPEEASKVHQMRGLEYVARMMLVH